MRTFITVLLSLTLLISVSLTTDGFAKDKKVHYMSVQFTVSDYAKWRVVFDEAAPLRASAHIENPRIYRSADNPNEILVIFDVPSQKEGSAWINSPTLREAWAKGGIIGDPIVGFVRFKPMKSKTK